MSFPTASMARTQPLHLNTSAQSNQYNPSGSPQLRVAATIQNIIGRAAVQAMSEKKKTGQTISSPSPAATIAQTLPRPASASGRCLQGSPSSSSFSTTTTPYNPALQSSPTISNASAAAAAAVTAALASPIQHQSRPANPPSSAISEAEHRRWLESTRLARELDETAIYLLLEIERESSHLPKDLVVRVEKWCVKLSSVSSTSLSLQKDRDTYLRLLLEMCQKKCLEFPFDKLPTGGVLPRLPAYMNLARPLPARKQAWHEVLKNLSTTFLIGSHHRAELMDQKQHQHECDPSLQMIGGPKEAQRQAWLQYYHRDHRSPERKDVRIYEPPDFIPAHRAQSLRGQFQNSSPTYGSHPGSPVGFVHPNALQSHPYSSPTQLRSPAFGPPGEPASNVQHAINPYNSAHRKFNLELPKEYGNWSESPVFEDRPLSETHPHLQQQSDHPDYSYDTYPRPTDDNLSLTHSFTTHVHPVRDSPQPYVSPTHHLSSQAPPQPATNAHTGLVSDVVVANLARDEYAQQRDQTYHLHHAYQRQSSGELQRPSGEVYHPFEQENIEVRKQRDHVRQERDAIKVRLLEVEFELQRVSIERDQLRKQNGELRAALNIHEKDPSVSLASLLCSPELDELNHLRSEAQVWAVERESLMKQIQGSQQALQERQASEYDQMRKMKQAVQEMRNEVADEVEETVQARLKQRENQQQQPQTSHQHRGSVSSIGSNQAGGRVQSSNNTRAAPVSSNEDNNGNRRGSTSTSLKSRGGNNGRGQVNDNNGVQTSRPGRSRLDSQSHENSESQEEYNDDENGEDEEYVHDPSQPSAKQRGGNLRSQPSSTTSNRWSERGGRFDKEEDEEQDVDEQGNSTSSTQRRSGANRNGRSRQQRGDMNADEAAGSSQVESGSDEQQSQQQHQGHASQRQSNRSSPTHAGGSSSQRPSNKSSKRSSKRSSPIPGASVTDQSRQLEEILSGLDQDDTRHKKGAPRSASKIRPPNVYDDAFFSSQAAAGQSTGRRRARSISRSRSRSNSNSGSRSGSRDSSPRARSQSRSRTHSASPSRRDFSPTSLRSHSHSRHFSRSRSPYGGYGSHNKDLNPVGENGIKVHTVKIVSPHPSPRERKEYVPTTEEDEEAFLNYVQHFQYESKQLAAAVKTPSSSTAATRKLQPSPKSANAAASAGTPANMPKTPQPAPTPLFQVETNFDPEEGTEHLELRTQL